MTNFRPDKITRPVSKANKFKMRCLLFDRHDLVRH